MRKTTLLAGIVAGLAIVLLAGLGTGAGTASADGGPHIATGTNATPDKCAGCHRIHTGQNEFLLKDAGTVEEFCYSCHGNGGPGSDLAVQEGTFYGSDPAGPAPYGDEPASTTLGLRAGGFEEARINTTDATASTIGVLATAQTVNSRHTLETATTAWGNGAIDSGPGLTPFTLECTTCHDPHGNGNYRILRTTPTGSGGGGYAIPDTYGKTYTTSNYFSMNFGALPANLPAGSTVAAGSSILVDSSRWCAQCHTRYLATRRGATPAESSRVDSGDDIFTFRHTSSGVSVGSTGTVSVVTRACITCHTSHGSNSSMPGNPTEGTTYSSTVEWPGDSTYIVNPTDPTRASMLKMDNRGMCKKCHADQ